MRQESLNNLNSHVINRIIKKLTSDPGRVFILAVMKKYVCPFSLAFLSMILIIDSTQCDPGGEEKDIEVKKQFELTTVPILTLPLSLFQVLPMLW